MAMSEKSRLWLARFLITVVTALNLQAALVFILWPERFMHGFELTGIPGAAAVRGTGILFVMWNVPYLVALWKSGQVSFGFGNYRSNAVYRFGGGEPDFVHPARWAHFAEHIYSALYHLRWQRTGLIDGSVLTVRNKQVDIQG